MSFIENVRQHTKQILNDRETAPGWPFAIVSPGGQRFDVVGFFKEIHLAEDLTTNDQFSIQQATVSYFTQDVPVRVVPTEVAPFWRVELTTPAGEDLRYAVADAMPSELMGNTVLTLKAMTL